MSKQEIPQEWQEQRQVIESLIAVGFSIQMHNTGVYSGQDRIYTITMFPRHQVEWLRTYADIFYVDPLPQHTFIVDRPDLANYLCAVAFRMKHPSVTLPFADVDAVLPPKPIS